MARRTVTITTCDICGDDEADEFWAEVTFRSRKYEYDDGTNPQNHNWTLCRGCKVILLNFMEFAAKQAKKEDIMAKVVQAVDSAKKRLKPKRRVKPKPRGPETCFERVAKGVLPDG